MQCDFQFFIPSTSKYLTLFHVRNFSSHHVNPIWGRQSTLSKGKKYTRQSTLSLKKSTLDVLFSLLYRVPYMRNNSFLEKSTLYVLFFGVNRVLLIVLSRVPYVNDFHVLIGYSIYSTLIDRWCRLCQINIYSISMIFSQQEYSIYSLQTLRWSKFKL